MLGYWGKGTKVGPSNKTLLICVLWERVGATSRSNPLQLRRIDEIHVTARAEFDAFGQKRSQKYIIITTMASLPPDSHISPSDSLNYWNSIPSTVSGMLGGYPGVSHIDLRTSLNFLLKLNRQFPPFSAEINRAADCGAGIGRVTQGFLRKVCNKVDIVEPVEKFALEAVANLRGHPHKNNKIDEEPWEGEIYIKGLESWIPETQSYDLFWNQWCLGHLTDSQLATYFRRCSDGLRRPGGWIVVKENMSTDAEGKDIFDEQDSSVTRTDESWRKIFNEAGLVLLKTELQTGFPKNLFPVRFYALRPGKVKESLV